MPQNSIISLKRTASPIPFDSYKKYISTEPDAQSLEKVQGLEKALEENDLNIYTEGINTTTLDGKTYILDGHHRIEAAKNIKHPQIYTKDLCTEEAKNNYPNKMEDIEKGEFD